MTASTASNLRILRLALEVHISNRDREGIRQTKAKLNLIVATIAWGN